MNNLLIHRQLQSISDREQVTTSYTLWHMGNMSSIHIERRHAPAGNQSFSGKVTTCHAGKKDCNIICGSVTSFVRECTFNALVRMGADEVKAEAMVLTAFNENRQARIDFADAWKSLHDALAGGTAKV